MQKHHKHYNNHNKQIITMLLIIVLLMVVGYAAFASKLNIKGTSNITSNWDVEITGITKDKTKGNVTEINAPTYTKDSATFNIGLESPGDYIYYKIAVTNKGSLAAIAKIGNLECSNSSVIECRAYSDSSVSANITGNTNLEDARLIIGPNETEYYNLSIKYNSDITSQPDITSENIKLTLTYTQSDVGITHKTEDNCYTGKVLKDGTLSITNYNESCGSNVTIPETIDGYTVTEIADGKWDMTEGKFISAFANKNITSVIMPNTITYIGYAAFSDNQIENISLSNTLVTIGSDTFRNNNLTNIILPSTLKTIGSSAFSNNYLTNIIIPSSVTNLEGGVFANNNIKGENAIIYGRNADGSIDYTSLESFLIKTPQK